MALHYNNASFSNKKMYDPLRKYYNSQLTYVISHIEQDF